MGKLTDEEARMLAELEKRRDAPDPPDDDDQDDDGHVVVLRGKRADTFLSSLFPSKGKGSKGKSADPAGKDDDQDDGKDDDQDDGKDDPKPPAAHRYFR